MAGIAAATWSHEIGATQPCPVGSKPSSASRLGVSQCLRMKSEYKPDLVFRRLGSAHGRQSFADYRLHFGWLRSERIAHPAQLPAEIVHLVEKTENERHRLFVYREFVTDFGYQFDPGDIHLVKDPGLIPPFRQYPAVLDPPAKLAAIQLLEADEQILENDHADGIPCRGSNGCCLAHFS